MPLPPSPPSSSRPPCWPSFGPSFGPSRLGRAALLAALASSALLPGCDDPQAPKATPRSPSPILYAAPGTYAEGTAFAIGGVPVMKADIEEYLPLMRMIDPHLVDTSLRRRALANIVLPIAAGQALDAEAYEAAFQKAQRIRAAVLETGIFPPDAPKANYLTGTWIDVGLVPFKAAAGMEPGTYSPLLESPAAFTFFKLVATNLQEGEAMGPQTELVIQRYDVPYLPDEASVELIQSAIDTLPLEIVDPEWEPIVPPILLYKSVK